jgi:fermentation-respiration switch protein FrsA (DUF1100 family)
MIRAALNGLLYFPETAVLQTPAAAGLAFTDVEIPTQDGERLHGWWIRARAPSASSVAGHVLFFHGNAGNVGDRILHAQLLCAVGLDVLLFDYRGYGHSTGRPSEDGTAIDARSALEALVQQPGVDPAGIFYIGESLGGAVALELALSAPPAGLVLQSTFTSVRDVARKHYPFIPAALVPDAYPSLERIRSLRAPLLVLHGDCDELIPVSHAGALADAAPEPKTLRVFPGTGHNDLVVLAGGDYARTIGDWVRAILSPR